MPDPEPAWLRFVSAQADGGVLYGHVTKVLPFGAMVEVADGVHGLLPRAAWSTRPEQGASIPVRVDTIDVQRRRVSLIPA